MGKEDLSAIISYWRDPGDGSGPDPNFDAEIFLGHHDEENIIMPITDIRGEEAEYSLDVNGFEALTLPVKESRDEVGKEDEYVDEIVEMLKEKTGAKHILPFLTMKRGLPRNALKPREFRGSGAQIQAPAPHPHLDVAPSNIHSFVNNWIPGGPSLLASHPNSRYQILGIWRPLKPVLRDPLVLLDATTMDDEDLRELSRDKTVPERKWVLCVVANPGGERKHRWCYWSGMGREEVLLFKHFDSERVGAWRCVHSSFEIPGTEGEEARESLEMRALVVY